MRRSLLHRLVILLVASLLSALFAVFLKVQTNEREALLIQAQSELRTAEARLKNVSEEAKDREQLAEFYAQFEQKNAHQKEDRLHVITLLKEVSAKQVLTLSEYRFSPKETLISSDGKTLFRSSFHFQMMIWHEGDVATVLNTLATAAKGLFIPKACTLTPLESPDENAPSLRLACQMSLLTTED